MNYLHKKKIAHRDIKPENLLLDENFNLKLCDFGWATEMDSETPRYSVCGTFEYMPPEVAHQDKHTLAADMWSLGILLYEMLHGHAPFKANSLEEIKLKVKTQQIRINADFSKETKDLIKLLLRQDSSRRLKSEQVVQFMETLFGKEKLESKLGEDLKFELYKNYYFNKFKIIDENIVRKKMIEDSFGIEQQDENRRMPFKYYRDYKLNEELIGTVRNIGRFILTCRMQHFGTEQGAEVEWAKEETAQVEE